MEPGQSAPSGAVALTEAQVVDYLEAHPEFFESHSELLSRISLRHRHGGKAVSLIERQIDVLRDRNRGLEMRLVEAVRNAQENDAIFDRLQSLVRALLLAPDAAAMPGIVEARLREGFGVPQVALRLWRTHARHAELAAATAVEPAVIEQTAALSTPYCGAPGEFRAVVLLAGEGVQTRSVALVPLRVGAGPEPFGLLVLGSADPDRFSPGLGTAFLSRIGEVLSAALSRLAVDPAPAADPAPTLDPSLAADPAPAADPGLAADPAP